MINYARLITKLADVAITFQRATHFLYQVRRKKLGKEDEKILTTSPPFFLFPLSSKRKVNQTIFYH